MEVISDSEAFTSESSASLAAFEAAKEGKDADKPEMGMDISIVSPEILNINFSKQMLSSLLRTARSWTEEAKKEEELMLEEGEKKPKKEPKGAKVVNNYSIRNLTGFNLYWTSHLEKKKGGEGEEIKVSVLPDNEEESLGENFKRKTRRAVSSVAKDNDNMYVVSMELEFFLTHLVPPSIYLHYFFLSLSPSVSFFLKFSFSFSF